MISFEKALEIILSTTKALGTENVQLIHSIGRVLAEDVFSGVDLPSFNKSAMDGYAVRVSDIHAAGVKLKSIGLIQAGQTFKKKIKIGECVKIMTGAALPEGADTVVMVEDTRQLARTVLIEKAVKKNKNVCFRGEDVKKGQRVLRKGALISVSDIALLGAIGKSSIKVIKSPSVSVLNTGGEIVPIGRRLKAGEIYNSNGPQLLALLRSDGLNPHFLGIAKDSPAQLRDALKKGLQSDILLVSGGVSVGDYDLVPATLKRLRVKKIFHKVKVKPGKPLFFGKKGKKIIFGIPGNPVANFLVYLAYVRPALYKMMGRKDYKLLFETGVLVQDFSNKSNRRHFVPVKIAKVRSRNVVTPVGSHGSADILALSKADGFMMCDENRRFFKKGSKIGFIQWE